MQEAYDHLRESYELLRPHQLLPAKETENARLRDAVQLFTHLMHEREDF